MAHRALANAPTPHDTRGRHREANSEWAEITASGAGRRHARLERPQTARNCCRSEGPAGEATPSIGRADSVLAGTALRTHGCQWRREIGPLGRRHRSVSRVKHSCRLASTSFAGSPPVPCPSAGLQWRVELSTGREIKEYVADFREFLRKASSRSGRPSSATS